MWARSRRFENSPAAATCARRLPPSSGACLRPPRSGALISRRHARPSHRRSSPALPRSPTGCAGALFARRAHVAAAACVCQSRHARLVAPRALAGSVMCARWCAGCHARSPAAPCVLANVSAAARARPHGSAPVPRAASLVLCLVENERREDGIAR